MFQPLPRVIATDLDGTIVRSDGTISERTLTALARVEEAGSMLVMVTGRPPRWMAGVAAAVGHHGVAICANGAIEYDLHTETTLRTREIPADVLAEAIARLRGVSPELRFAVEYADRFVFEHGYAVERWDVEAIGGRFVDDAELVSRSCTKLLGFQNGVDPDVLAEKAVQAVGDIVTVTHSSGAGLLEISAHGVTKASALAALCARHGVAAADVTAFGDMPNDLAMLMWAGTSYAVANAHPLVLDAVTHRTSRNDDDGVAEVLERLFP
jgi:Cof subfamily protein (haloacid dehalogenase superfamily)